LSISPSIDSKEDFNFLFIRNFKFSWQYYNEDPYAKNETEKTLNMKDIEPKVDAKKGKTDKKGVRRVTEDGKPVLVDDSNLYTKIAEEDIVAERITKLGSLSLEDLRDVITKLTMIKALPNESQVALRGLHLNLRPAQRRCENIHGGNNCTTVWGTLAVKKCRGGYIRAGCCRCSLPCPDEGFIDEGPTCRKAKPYQTNSYSELEDCETKNELNKDICVDLGMGSYTEKCDPGFIRSGRYTCVKTCPVGWPDEGSFCTKIGNVEDSLPFPWMPGDPKQ